MNFIADLRDVQFGIFCDLQFFSLGLCEGTGVCPPLPANLGDLKQIIITALQAVTQDMLQWALEELEYQIDISCVSGGAHLEHL